MSLIGVKNPAFQETNNLKTYHKKKFIANDEKKLSLMHISGE